VGFFLRSFFFYCEQSRRLLWAFLPKRRRGRIKRGENGAAVKILRAAARKEFWEPQEAAKPRMPGVRVTSLRVVYDNRRLRAGYPLRSTRRRNPQMVSPSHILFLCAT